MFEVDPTTLEKIKVFDKTLTTTQKQPLRDTTHESFVKTTDAHKHTPNYHFAYEQYDAGVAIINQNPTLLDGYYRIENNPEDFNRDRLAFVMMIGMYDNYKRKGDDFIQDTPFTHYGIPQFGTLFISADHRPGKYSIALPNGETIITDEHVRNLVSKFKQTYLETFDEMNNVVPTPVNHVVDDLLKVATTQIDEMHSATTENRAFPGHQ